MRYHQLTGGQIQALADGTGDVSAIKELTDSRVSLHLLMFRHVVESWSAAPAERDTAVAALAQAQAEDAGAFAELFGDPMVGAWLTRTCRGTPPKGDLLQLGALAAAAALRCGGDCRVTGWMTDGGIVLPTMGTVIPTGPTGPTDGPVTIEVTRGTLARVAFATELTWLPMRRLKAPDFSVRLEDQSPYRDGYHAPPSERLTVAEADRWQDTFAEAWELIDRYLPERAAEIAVGLRAIVPLVDLGDGSSRSGTGRESVGALGTTKPRSAVDFAVTIVHEFEHSKLSAVIDVSALYHPDGSELHHAPWRKDPRPTSGLIQGVGAFLRVAQVWQRFTAIPDLAELAEAEFMMVRDQVKVGYEALDASHELTAAGRRYVAAMRPALVQLFSPSVAGDAPKPAW